MTTLKTPSQSLIDLDSIKKEQVALEIQGYLQAEYGASVALVPEGYKVQDLSFLTENALHFIAHLGFSDINEWSRYITDQKLEKDLAVCLIDQDRMTAKATLDKGNTSMPLHSQHTANLALKPTPEYEALNAINSRAHGQKELADWVEDWAHCITGTDDSGEEMTAKQIAHSFRNITISETRNTDSEVGDFHANRSVLQKVEAKNKERQTLFVNMFFKPYDDLSALAFTLRVTSGVSGKEPVITLRVVGLEQSKRELALEFKSLVTQALDGKEIKTYVAK